ncbi:phage scaffolding protein [Caproicibacterium sp. XB1]|uniref:phage scaffolding protein n=1 Tax=Caproicibacterium sp. XB1 TaxID=3396405 RepID=UPI0039B6F39E
MTKEQAKALGLDDAAAEKVAAESAKELKEYVKKSDYDTLSNEKAQLEKDVKTRDGQIEQLKKADPEKLQQTITDLQTQNATDKAAYEKQLKEQKVDAAVQLALAGSGALNAKAVRALLEVDPEKAEFAEDGSLKGLSEQIQALQKAEDSKMLFKDANAKPVLKGFKPAEGSDRTPESGGMDDFFGAFEKAAGIAENTNGGNE